MVLYYPKIQKDKVKKKNQKTRRFNKLKTKRKQESYCPAVSYSTFQAA